MALGSTQTHLDFEPQAGVAVDLVVDRLRSSALDVVVIVVVVVFLDDVAEENDLGAEPKY